MEYIPVIIGFVMLILFVVHAQEEINKKREKEVKKK